MFDLDGEYSIDDVNRAYKSLVKQYHPDFHNNSPASNIFMEQINEAREILLRRADTDGGHTYETNERHSEQTGSHSTSSHESTYQSKDTYQSDDQRNYDDGNKNEESKQSSHHSSGQTDGSSSDTHQYTRQELLKEFRKNYARLLSEIYSTSTVNDVESYLRKLERYSCLAEAQELINICNGRKKLLQEERIKAWDRGPFADSRVNRLSICSTATLVAMPILFVLIIAPFIGIPLETPGTNKLFSLVLACCVCALIDCLLIIIYPTLWLWHHNIKLSKKSFINYEALAMVALPIDLPFCFIAMSFCDSTPTSPVLAIPMLAILAGLLVFHFLFVPSCIDSVSYKETFFQGFS